MKKDTLTKQMTIKQYAEWVYDTKAWERIKFSTWKQRLKQYRLTAEFWEAYKQHKTQMQGETETYQQYLERKQKEQTEEYPIHDEEEY